MEIVTHPSQLLLHGRVFISQSKGQGSIPSFSRHKLGCPWARNWKPNCPCCWFGVCVYVWLVNTDGPHLLCGLMHLLLEALKSRLLLLQLVFCFHLFIWGVIEYSNHFWEVKKKPPSNTSQGGKKGKVRDQDSSFKCFSSFHLYFLIRLLWALFLDNLLTVCCKIMICSLYRQ